MEYTIHYIYIYVCVCVCVCVSVSLCVLYTPELALNISLEQKCKLSITLW